MSVLSEDFMPKGALLACFKSFPQFRNDLETLISEGFLKVTGCETCK
jgi:hypothetical protein